MSTIEFLCGGDDYRGPMTTEDRPTPASTAELRSELIGRLRGVTIAWSVSGRDVGFITGFDSGLEIGGFAVASIPEGPQLLVQVHELHVTERDAVRVDLDTDDLGGGNSQVRSAQVGLALRSVGGTGQVLARVIDDGVGPFTPTGFTEAALAPAPDDLVAAYTASMIGSAVGLPLGHAGSAGSVAMVKASGFSRHTFLVGQSGSGKTYTLGVMLERLLVHTSLPLIVVDPNSDSVHLGTMLPREKVAGRGQPPITEAAYESLTRAMAASGEVVVARAGGALPLRIHLSDLDVGEQALALGLDPTRDRDEYSTFLDIVDELSTQPHYGLDLVTRHLQARSDETSGRLLHHLRNQRVANWKVWATSEEPSLTSLMQGRRAVILDTGSLDDARERSILALAVLGHLRRRDERISTMLVIDEAHNLFGPDTGDALQSAVAEHGVWIAGEGRKYGVHMLVSTQRPQKIRRNILSQCDNLVLMRMNSNADIEELAAVFSHVPPSMIAEAKSFRQGEMLVAGPIASPPLRVQVAERWCPEGGADLPTTWANAGALSPADLAALTTHAPT